ncbi:hypothetical protein EMCRGX_G027356 [Ephydatia muelleri]
MATTFGYTKDELSQLMTLRKKDALDRLQEMGGTEAIVRGLQTNPTTGLSDSEAELEGRRTVYGRNHIESDPPKWFIALALDALSDKVLLILIGAAILEIVLGLTVSEHKHTAWVEGAAILVAVSVVVLVTAFNDWTKERQFRGLQTKLESTQRFSVLRNGEIKELQPAEIVVGDIAKFKYGNNFPCDGLIISGFDVAINESALTGESMLIKKTPESDPFLLAGTQVMEGGGTMIVTAVGENSQQGIILMLLADQDKEEGFFEGIWNKVKSVYRMCRGDQPAPDPEAGKSGSASPPPKEPQDTAADAQPQGASAQFAGEEDIVKTEEYEPAMNKVEEEHDREDHSPPPSTNPLLRCWHRITGKDRDEETYKGLKQEEGEEEKSKQEDKKEGGSILQGKLTILALRISKVGMAAGVLCIVILMLKFSIQQFAIIGRAWGSEDATTLLNFFVIGITVLVVAVPEGLPLAITIALAYSVKKMLKDNNLVRHLHACETMGNATTICSDKTGTLTMNRMTVVESFIGTVKFGDAPELSRIPKRLLDILSLNIAVNSSYSSKIVEPEDPPEDVSHRTCLGRVICFYRPVGGDVVLGKRQPDQVGNITECALLGFVRELGIDYEALRAQHPTETFVKVFTFNSARKSMSTVIPLEGGGYRLLTKGASEIILYKCTQIMGNEGEIIQLTEGDHRRIYNTVIYPMAQGSLRTICLAFRDFPSDTSCSVSATDVDNESEVVSSLTFLAIVGIQDPVRPEVPACIKQCQDAGIVVRMVTGDNLDTAKAVAEKCGIIQRDRACMVMEGKDFNKKIRDYGGKVVQMKMDAIWPRLLVLARSSPKDKYTLVDGIIKSNYKSWTQVVAVTGDGTNDAPALKRADIGFAMGIAGTDVAKEACDIILTDDNFASIVKAVIWGRNIYDAITKFLQFQLTVNVVAVTLALTSAITIGDSPIRAIQLLWVNMIMDTFASLALATESPSPELLKRKPYGRNKALISPRMWAFLIGHISYQLIVLFVLVYGGATLFDIDDGVDAGASEAISEHFTLIFNVFVFMQIFNEINARKIHGERNIFQGLHHSYTFLIIMVGQVVFQVILVQFGSIVVQTSGLTLDLWLWSIFLGSTELVVGQIIAMIPVERLPKCKETYVEIPGFIDPLSNPRAARVLWIKNVSRLRSQIRVINAFRAGLDRPSRHSSRGYLAPVTLSLVMPTVK